VVKEGAHPQFQGADHYDAALGRIQNQRSVLQQGFTENPVPAQAK